MAYKLAVLVALAAAATLSVDFTSSQTVIGSPYVAQLFLENGTNIKVNDSVPDIYKLVGKFNYISSACVSGIWDFYETFDYNTFNPPGKMIHTSGIDYCRDIEAIDPDGSVFTARSLRYAGSPTSFGEESFTFYEDSYFRGAHFVGTEDYSDLEIYVKSYIIMGESPWTLYIENNYAGEGLCERPETLGRKGNKTLYGGEWPAVSPADGLLVRSMKKGCNSTTTLRSQPLPASHQAANGATGSFRLPKQ